MCDDVQTEDDIDYLIDYAEALGSEAMVNYPYPTNFVKDLPAWPVDASCAAALATPSKDPVDYIKALAGAI